MFGNLLVLSVNGANYDAASAAIGGDLVEARLWWDKFLQPKISIYT